jgi:transcription initiation factor TFIIA large subunit
MNDSNGPRIKTEPGLENGIQGVAPPPFNSMSGLTAQQRAAQNLAAQYGSRAAASINAIQGGMPQQGQPSNLQQQQQRPQGGMQPGGGMTQAQYQQAMAAQMAQQRRAQAQSQAQNQAQNQNQSPAGANNGQTDGAGDIDEPIGIMKRINSQGEEIEMGRVEIDHMIRSKIEAMGQTMEGGGLMLPLHERYPTGRSKNRKMVSANALVAAQKSSSGAPSRFDGGDDDDDDDKSGIIKDEDDEDAINSDLDDPDDGLNDDEDDDEGQHVMLCMYDKVQRVKNKW